MRVLRVLRLSLSNHSAGPIFHFPPDKQSWLKDATTRISSSLSEFDAPFLVQHGKADRVTDPQLSQMLYDEAKSEDKTIHLYDGKKPIKRTTCLSDSPIHYLQTYHFA